MVTSATNPFYVDPMGDVSQGLYGLAGQVQRLGEKRRDDEAKAEIQEAFASKNPDLIAKAMVKHPKYANVLQGSMQFYNDATKKNYIDSIREAIGVIKSPADRTDEMMAPGETGEMTDPKLAKLEDIVRRRKQFMDEVGVPAEQRRQTDAFLENYKTNPEQALSMLEHDLATLDPDTTLKLAQIEKTRGLGAGKTIDSIEKYKFWKKLGRTDPEGAKSYGMKEGFIDKDGKQKDNYILGKKGELIDISGKKPRIVLRPQPGEEAMTPDERKDIYLERLRKLEEQGKIRKGRAKGFAIQIGREPKPLDPTEEALKQEKIKELQAKERRLVSKEEAETLKKEEVRTLKKSRATRLLGEVQELVDYANSHVSATGWRGWITSKAPETPGYILQEKTKLAKANLTKEFMDEMRAMSPSGATGLGQISNRELSMLESAIAVLNTKMGKKEYIANLEKAQKHWSNWLMTLDKNVPEGYTLNEKGILVETPEGATGAGGRKVPTYTPTPEAIREGLSSMELREQFKEAYGKYPEEF